MAKRTGKTENLIPVTKRTKEEARVISRNGGIKSGEVRKEKKLMSQILADYLQKQHEVVVRDEDGAVIDREKVSAEELINRTITAVMARGDSASASMIKTLGELTEGSKVDVSGGISISVNRETVGGKVKELGTVKRQSKD